MISDFNSFKPLIHEVFHPIVQEHKISLNVLRLDLMDPLTGGNKWFKLKCNLEEAERLGKNTIISFGGPYSNHIAALASAGSKLGFETVGIIRGKVHNDNPTLLRAKSQGMRLISCDHDKYRLYRNPENWTELYDQFPDAIIIPEGGSNKLGVKGCKLIAKLIPENTNHVFLPVGTGATMAGLICGGEERYTIEGVAVVKANGHFEKEINRMLEEEYLGMETKIPNDFLIHHDYTFGGYAKSDLTLNSFVEDFISLTSIPIEPIYTGRMIYGIIDRIKKGNYKVGSVIVAIHTGGLQYLMS